MGGEQVVVVVILRDRLEPRGNGIEAGGLGRELAGVGVSAADDQRQGLKRGIVQLVLVEEGVERAVVAVVAELDSRNVVRSRPFALGLLHDLTRGDEQEGCLPVDESADQPGARDAINARFLAGNPFHVCPAPYLRLFVWSSAALSAWASFVGSSLAQKCM